MPSQQRNDDRDTTEADRELEAALKLLKPVCHGVNDDLAAGSDVGLAYRDQVMFRAGEAAGEQNARAAARRQVWAWRGVAACLAAISVTCLIRIADRPQDRLKVVFVHGTGPGGVTVASGPSPSVPGDSRIEAAVQRTTGDPARQDAGGEYLVTRAAVLRWGVAALPRADSPHTSAGDAEVLSVLSVSKGLDQGPAPSANERSAPSPLESVEQFFRHQSDGGRL